MSNDGNEIMGSGQDAPGHQVLGTETDGREMEEMEPCQLCVTWTDNWDTAPTFTNSQTSVPRLLLLLCHT